LARLQDILATIVNGELLAGRGGADADIPAGDPHDFAPAGVVVEQDAPVDRAEHQIPDVVCPEPGSFRAAGFQRYHCLAGSVLAIQLNPRRLRMAIVVLHAQSAGRAGSADAHLAVLVNGHPRAHRDVAVVRDELQRLTVIAAVPHVLDNHPHRTAAVVHPHMQLRGNIAACMRRGERLQYLVGRCGIVADPQVSRPA
jgi:hypothetical protein